MKWKWINKKTIICLTLLLALLLPSVSALKLNGWVNMPFELTAYDTTIQSASNWQFTSATLTPSYLQFNNTVIGAGTPFNLTITTINANLTFNQLCNGETIFQFTSNGMFTITLSGYGEAPSNAEIGSTTKDQALPYNYNIANDTLTLNVSYDGSELIALNLPSATSSLPSYPPQNGSAPNPGSGNLAFPSFPQLTVDEWTAFIASAAVICTMLLLFIYQKKKT